MVSMRNKKNVIKNSVLSRALRPLLDMIHYPGQQGYPLLKMAEEKCGPIHLTKYFFKNHKMLSRTGYNNIYTPYLAAF